VSVLTTSQTGNGCSGAGAGSFGANPTNGPIPVRVATNSWHSESFAVRLQVLPLLFLLVVAATLSGEDWHVGKEFRNALQTEISVTMEGSPIREGLGRLARSQGISLFVDRRIDPTREITVAAERQPLDDVIRRIARQQALGVGYVGPVVYVGPPLTAARIATLAALRNQQATGFEPKLRSKMLTKKSLIWPRLSEPRWVVRKLAAEAGLALPAAQAIPHDLFEAGDYPPMTLAERLTLVLSGFGMTYSVDEKEMRLRLKRIPRDVAIDKVYTAPGDVGHMAATLQNDFPQAFIRTDGNELHVRSTIEDHWAIETSLSPRQRRRPTSGNAHVYTLTVKDQPLGKLIEQIAARIGLQVKFSAEAIALKDHRVSFAVTSATLEELFEAAVESANLTATVEGALVRIE
jgi:hypothetical protein